MALNPAPFFIGCKSPCLSFLICQMLCREFKEHLLLDWCQWLMMFSVVKRTRQRTVQLDNQNRSLRVERLRGQGRDSRKKWADPQLKQDFKASVPFAILRTPRRLLLWRRLSRNTEQATEAPSGKSRFFIEIPVFLWCHFFHTCLIYLDLGFMN